VTVTVTLTGRDHFAGGRSDDDPALVEVDVDEQVVIVGSPEALTAAAHHMLAIVASVVAAEAGQ
jgi:hypothetical protein